MVTSLLAVHIVSKSYPTFLVWHCGIYMETNVFYNKPINDSGISIWLEFTQFLQIKPKVKVTHNFPNVVKGCFCPIFYILYLAL